MTKEEAAALLAGATYAGDGAEGLVLVSGAYAIKYWWSSDEWDTSYLIWRDYHAWPQHVRDVMVRLEWHGELNGRPVTVTERVSPDAGLEVTPAIADALRWLSDEYGYAYEHMIETQNLGTRADGSVVMYDIC